MSQIQHIIADIWNRVQQTQMSIEEADAQRDPLTHKLSRVMERGKPLSYYWWAVKPSKTREVRYCYSVHRNVAGFYLGWREVVTTNRVKRDMWVGRRVKARCIDVARERAKVHKAKLRSGLKSEQNQSVGPTPHI